MKTYQCIAHSGATGKEIVFMVRAMSSTNAKMDGLKQARQMFGNNAGAVTLVSVTEMG